MKTIGVIGGSGLYEIDGLSNVKTVSIITPWGTPSASLITGILGSVQMVFLPRHGQGHVIPPSKINFRANIYAMKSMGVERIISISAVGSMKEKIKPGDVVLPDQFIDNTKGRPSTFFEDGVVAHVSMADPVCSSLCGCLSQVAVDCGARVHPHGTYVCIEGPQFSTRAESELYRKWEVDVIGMTAMPEARLAREAEICYSTVALSTDYDCWKEDHEDVTVSDVIETMNRNVIMAKKILARAVDSIPEKRDCECAGALAASIITPVEQITLEARNKVELILKKYL